VEKKNVGSPICVILAGPNGAGKSTASKKLLPENYAISDYVNPDAVARGLSLSVWNSGEVEIGRIVWSYINNLVQQRSSFAFETTLAGRGYASKLVSWSNAGYKTHLIFFALPSPDIAADRVARRAKLGGNDLPKEDITRHFVRGLKNLFNLYIPLVSRWRIFDSSDFNQLKLIAEGSNETLVKVYDEKAYKSLKEWT
jgi:predicted ABC-type ATPase